MVYDLNSRLIRAENANGRLHNLIDKERSENIRLCETVKDYRRVQKVLGEADGYYYKQGKAEEQALKRPVRSRSYGER